METPSIMRSKANLPQRRLKPKGIESTGAMKTRVSKSSERSEPLSTERLCGIWEKVRSDTDARKALERLGHAGFRISHLTPRDASFKHPNWADYIASLPLLPNEPTTRRIHQKTTFRKYWPLIRELHRLAANVNAPFVELKIYGTRDYPFPVMRTLQEDLLKAASILEHFLSWDWSVRHLNPRNAVIAELRWAIRERTGRPHDGDLNILLDAAFRAAGKEKCYIDSTTLDRIEKRQKEGRVKAGRRVRSLN